ncbi:oxidoreductase NAD-binding domain-containing protein 1-like isoform X2 [Pollicipes pollicipes]|uniref:oxidoreductase NAD-binding domain-containing protein 1-like isoform X2 n=1 Tax=Pollicipes pollicipes TaxID=41117 RepID=UPI001884AAFE|nr:oxidoreductase NAD-binding domain-containing protein 1-like isoform X2 [Pollicipes pollicipes]
MLPRAARQFLRVWNFTTSRGMSAKKDHLNVTAGQFRHEVTTSAVVADMITISPTVCSLIMKVEDKTFGFYAGWTSPSLAQTWWAGTACAQAQASCGVMVRWSWLSSGPAGPLLSGSTASFFFQPSAGAPVRPLLLVAGGVGVNPLISILRHCRDLRDEARHTGHGYTPMPVALVYSARSPAELLFKECIGAMEEEGLVTAHLFVTGKSLPAQDGRYHRGRLTSADLREVVRRLGADPLCYLCGPSAMIADVERWLTELGVPPESVRYERWW